MKKLRLILFILPLVFLACKKEGCQDMNALNFDAEAKKSGTCQYTKVIFYAGSDMIGGVGLKVTKIEVSRRILNEDELIGTIAELSEQSPMPDGCSPTANSVTYQFTTQVEDALFTTRYYFENGVEDNGDTYTFSNSSTTECHVQNLTL